MIKRSLWLCTGVLEDSQKRPTFPMLVISAPIGVDEMPGCVVGAALLCYPSSYSRTNTPRTLGVVQNQCGSQIFRCGTRVSSIYGKDVCAQWAS